MNENAEMRILIQLKNAAGEFETIKTNKDIVGVIFDEDIPQNLIIGSGKRMVLAANMMIGYAIGRDEAMNQLQITKVDDAHV